MAPRENVKPRIPFTNRIQVRLVAGFIVLALVPITLTSIYAYGQAKRGFREEVGQNVSGVAHVVRNRVIGAINVADQQLGIWSSQHDAKVAPQVYGQTFSIYVLLQKRFRTFLAGQRELLPLFAAIVSVKPGEPQQDPNKRPALVLFANDPAYEGKVVLPDFWVIDESGKPVVNLLYRWGASQSVSDLVKPSPFLASARVLTIARQYADADGKPVALAGLVDWGQMQSLIEETAVGGQKLGELARARDTYVVLADSRGRVLGGTSPVSFPGRAMRDIIESFQPGETSKEIEIQGLGDVVVAVEPAEAELRIVAIKSSQVAMAPVARLRNAMIVAGLLVLLAILVSGFQMGRRFTAPLRRLVEGTQVAAGGNLDTSIDVKTKDEVGELALSFNIMVAQLKESFGRLGSQNEELKRLDKLKDEFLANTSHELRTPLNGIIGLLSATLEGAYGPVAGKQRQTIEMAVSSAKRLAGLVNGILDFSAAKKGKAELKIESFSIVELIEGELKPLFEGVNRAKGLDLRFHLARELPSAIIGDKEKIRQVVMNLLGNAVKFTKQGFVELRLSPNPQSGGKRLLLSVRDSGIGIPADQLEAIFEPFRQVQGAANREFEGTGLGLSIVKSHVELHGGRIWVESKMGEGSTFMVDLPVEATQDRAQEPPKQVVKAPAALKAPAAAPAPVVVKAPAVATAAAGAQKVVGAGVSPGTGVRGGSKELLWVVDDEPVNIEVLRAWLEMFNYRVVGFPSAVAALEELKKKGTEHPELLLLDIMMPVMSGYDLLGHIKQNPSWSHIPIIFVSAKNLLVDKVYGLNLGAIDYVTKPIEKDELLTKIRNFLDLRIGQRMKEELAVASAVQSLLVPELSLQGERVRVFGKTDTCTETGGDWFLVLDDPELGAATLAIADVAGHGAGAALVTGILHGYFSSAAGGLARVPSDRFVQSTEQLLRGLNHMVMQIGSKAPSISIAQTVMVVRLDYRQGKALCVNAGHQHPVVLKSPGNGNGAEAKVSTLITRPSTPIGYGTNLVFGQVEFPLHAGDSVVLYTDGLVECTNRAGKPYGMRRLQKVLLKAAGLSPEKARELVYQDAMAFYGDNPRSDDITMIVSSVS